VSTHERTLLVGVKALIAPSLVPAASVFYGDLPATTPDRAVALNCYAATDEAKVALSRLRLQVMVRGVVNDSLDAGDLADTIFDALHGLENLWFGGVHLVQCFRISRVPLGIDSAKRTTRADNYECDVDLPVTAGRPF
jgi:hypothetical protein